MYILMSYGQLLDFIYSSILELIREFQLYLDKNTINFFVFLNDTAKQF